jgi:hypothetical protein
VKVAFGKLIENAFFIFCTVHVSSGLVTIFVPSIFRGLRETHVISTSTWMSKVFAANTTYLRNMKITFA